jgi:hypothetical protein
MATSFILILKHRDAILHLFIEGLKCFGILQFSAYHIGGPVTAAARATDRDGGHGDHDRHDGGHGGHGGHGVCSGTHALGPTGPRGSSVARSLSAGGTCRRGQPEDCLGLRASDRIRQRVTGGPARHRRPRATGPECHLMRLPVRLCQRAVASPGRAYYCLVTLAGSRPGGPVTSRPGSHGHGHGRGPVTAASRPGHGHGRRRAGLGP